MTFNLRGLSREPNNQLYLCTKSVSEGEVEPVKPFKPPVIHYRLFQGDGSDVISVAFYGVRVSMMFHLMFFSFYF